MKRCVVACGALLAMLATSQAADLGRKPVYKATPAPVVVPMFNWSGFYVGGHIGWGWQDSDTTQRAASAAFPAGTVFNTRSDGFLGGGQVGFNWQTGNWVLGVEGDFSWTDADGTTLTASTLTPGLVSNATFSYDWFATLTGRLGYAWNNWLVYAKGGAAWADMELASSATTAGVVTLAFPITDTRFGWTVGAGVEHGFAGSWSWKLEYNYMDFGSEDYASTTTTGVVTPISIDVIAHAVKLGLNYRLWHW